MKEKIEGDKLIKMVKIVFSLKTVNSSIETKWIISGFILSSIKCTYHGYRDREIDCIFKTKEKAEEYCKEKNESLEQLLQKTWE